MSTCSLTFTNSFGNSASSSFGTVARSVTVPVAVAIWLLTAYSVPVASRRLLSLLYTSTGSRAPALKRCSTRPSAFCGTLNSTVVGFIVVMTAMPGWLDSVT